MNQLKNARFGAFKNRLVPVLKHPGVPFFILFAVLLVLHFGLPLYINDDLYYHHGAANGILFMVKSHYQTWSSRVILEFLAFSVAGLPDIVWRVANPLVITALLYGIAVAAGFAGRRGANALLCCLMLGYNWAILCSAGWIVTSVFVVWPAAAAMPALACLRDAMRPQPPSPLSDATQNAKRSPVRSVISVLLLLVAVNTEQGVVFMLLLLGCCLIYRLARREKLPPLLFIYLTAALAGLVLILVCPGSKLRAGNSIASFFNNYPMRSTLQNVELGVSKALSDINFGVSIPFLFLFLLCAWAVWKQNRKIIYTLIALVPLGVNLVFGPFRRISFALVPKLSFFTNALVADGIIRVDNVWRLASVLPFVLLCICFGCSVVSLYLAFGHSRAAFWAICFFLVGFCSSAMMGFSPSIWASGERTGFYFTLVAMALCGALYRHAVLSPAGKAVFLGGAGLLAARGTALIVQLWVPA